MSFWSALGGAVSGSGNILGTILNYGYQKKLQQHQYDLQIRGLKESPTASRLGLEKAGYNPIMALGNTNAYATGGPASGVTQSTLGSDISNGATNALQRKQYEANINKINAETKFIETQTENLGNTPTNAIGNFMKGLLGHEGESSVQFSQSLGKAVKEFGQQRVNNLLNKLKELSNPNPNPNSNYFYDIGVSNHDEGFIRYHSKGSKTNASHILNGQDISLTPEDLKIINSIKKSARKYSRPPREFPR